MRGKATENEAFQQCLYRYSRWAARASASCLQGASPKSAPMPIRRKPPA